MDGKQSRRLPKLKEAETTIFPCEHHASWRLRTEPCEAGTSSDKCVATNSAFFVLDASTLPTIPEEEEDFSWSEASFELEEGSENEFRAWQESADTRISYAAMGQDTRRTEGMDTTAEREELDHGIHAPEEDLHTQTGGADIPRRSEDCESFCD